MRRLNDHHVQAQYAAKQEEAAYRVFDSAEDDEVEAEPNRRSTRLLWRKLVQIYLKRQCV